jgi:uncharacterized protein (TIGR00369 family)
MGDPIFRSRSCFVCGTDNPHGLAVAPEREGDKVVVHFTPGDAHRGFSKAVHGGITASLLDEVVGVAAGQGSASKCATVELTIAYKRPVLVGVPVRAEGWFVGQEGRLVLGEGQIVDAEGGVLATARGKFMALDAEQAARFVGPDD